MFLVATILLIDKLPPQSPSLSKHNLSSWPSCGGAKLSDQLKCSHTEISVSSLLTPSPLVLEANRRS